MGDEYLIDPEITLPIVMIFMATHRLKSDPGNRRRDSTRPVMTSIEIRIDARDTQAVSDAPNRPPSMTAAVASKGCRYWKCVRPTRNPPVIL